MHIILTNEGKSFGSGAGRGAKDTEEGGSSGGVAPGFLGPRDTMRTRWPLMVSDRTLGCRSTMSCAASHRTPCGTALQGTVSSGTSQIQVAQRSEQQKQSKGANKKYHSRTVLEPIHQPMSAPEECTDAADFLSGASRHLGEDGVAGAGRHGGCQQLPGKDAVQQHLRAVVVCRGNSDVKTRRLCCHYNIKKTLVPAQASQYQCADEAMMTAALLLRARC